MAPRNCVKGTKCGAKAPWRNYNSPQTTCQYPKFHKGKHDWDDPLTKQIYDTPMGMTD